MARIDTLNNFLLDIANKFREKLGITGKIEHVDYDNKIDEVYNKGMNDEWSNFWDAYQINGARKDYSYTFNSAGWTNENFKPKWSMTPTIMEYMFSECQVSGDLKTILDEMNITLDTSQCTNFERAFRYASFTSVPTIDTTNCDDLSYLFYYATKLVTIDKLILREDGSQIFTNGSFNYCKALQNINEIVGKIGGNSLRFYGSSSNKSDLSHDTMINILNALMDKSSDTSGTEYVVQFGTRNLELLSEDEKRIATNKGWTLT